MKITIQLIRKLKTYMKSQILNLLLLTLCICISLVFGFVLRNIIDKGIQKSDINYLILYTSIYFMILVLAFFLNISKDYLTAFISGSIVKEFRIDLFNSIKYRSLISLKDNKYIGSLTTCIISDVEQLGQYYTRILLQTLINILYIIITAGILLYWDYKSLLLCIIFSPIIYLLVQTGNKKIKESSVLKRKSVSEIQSISSEYVKNQKISEFNTDNNTIDKIIVDKITSCAESTIKNDYQIKFTTQLLKYISQVPRVLLYLYGGFSIINGNDFTIGKLLAIVFYADMLMYAISVVSANLTEASKSLVSIGKILEMISLRDLEDIDIANLKSNKDKHIIELDKISVIFNNKSILKNVTYNFVSGKRNIILGKNGTGKTTLINSILGLSPINSGTIKYNEIEYSYPNTKGLNSIFSCSFQNKEGFDFLTVEENLKGVLSSTNFSLYCKSLQFDFNNLKLEMFKALSGGEKKKVSLLNALCTQKEIIILDEPTNHLDSDAVEGLKIIVQNIIDNKLVILITHDQNLISAEDEILDLSSNSFVYSA